VTRFPRVLGVCLLLCGLASLAPAQNTDALSQTFHAPKGDVEQALKDLNAYQSGRLPFVEGFVGSIQEPLASFQRAYYQYTLNVQQTNEAEVKVSVNAKISAWHEEKDASKSGYRDLPSNGRLEADLLDRLRGRLQQHSADLAASRTPLVSPRLLGTTETPTPSAPAQTSQPEAPPVATAAAPAFRPFANNAPPATPPAATSPEQDARYQRLVREEKSLNEVLAAQQHPDNLVAVKSAHTPIVASPSEGSKVVMYADAEDEFQFLKSEGAWIHVQIAGLSRGWIRSSQVEGTGPKTTSAAAAIKSPDLFRQTKEETSTFPGDWEALRGKSVKIIWVQPNGKSTQQARLTFAESVFKKQVPQLAATSGVEGVVVVFDAAEGGMAATTLAALQQWGAGNLSDAAFLKQCWFDPADAFAASASR
jgi:hypothetical protein